MALIYTPIVIRLLGQSEFGLYSLIGSLAAYFSILDMGLGNTIVRYISRNREVGNKKSESNLNGTFLLLYSAIGILTIIIGLFVLFNVKTIFGGSMSSQELYQAKQMIIILIINFSLSFPLSVFNSIIKAYERFVVDKLISILRILIGPIATIPFLLMGYGSVSMVLVTTIVNISCLLFAAFYSLRSLKVNFSFKKIETKLLREIFGYSFFIFLNIIVDQIFWKTDQLILGIVSGTMTVAVYAIAMQFINLYIQLSTAISNLLLPKLSIMVAKNAGKTEFTNEMIKYGRIQFLLIGYILSGFYLFGSFFINVWAGEDYQEAYKIVLIVMIPLTIPLIQNVGITILQALNKMAFRSVLYSILALLNLFISIPLAMYYGGVGTAVATSLSLLMGHVVIMNIYYHKKIGINIKAFWKNIIPLVYSLFISIFLGKVLIRFLQIDSILGFSVGIISYSLIYCLMNWKLGLNNHERLIFKSMVRRII